MFLIQQRVSSVPASGPKIVNHSRSRSKAWKPEGLLMASAPLTSHSSSTFSTVIKVPSQWQTLRIWKSAFHPPQQMHSRSRALFCIQSIRIKSILGFKDLSLSKHSLTPRDSVKSAHLRVRTWSASWEAGRSHISETDWWGRACKTSIQRSHSLS